MKIYVEVLTPGNGKKYEVAFDDKSIISNVKKKVTNDICATEGNIQGLSDIKYSIGNVEDVKFYSMETKEALPDNKNARSAGIKSGQTLILI